MIYKDPSVIASKFHYYFSPPLSIQRGYEYTLSQNVVTLHDDQKYDPIVAQSDKKLFIQSSDQIILEKTTSKNPLK